MHPSEIPSVSSMPLSSVTSFSEENSTSVSSSLEEHHAEKIIDLSFLCRPATVKRRLNMNEAEVITKFTYKELIRQKQEQGLPFILALIKTKEQGAGRFYHCFSGADIRRWLQAHPINPIAPNQTVKRVLYFTIQGLADSYFSYLGQEQFKEAEEFEDQGFIDTFFLASEGDIEAQYSLGLYYEEAADSTKALQWFQRASLKNHISSLYKLADYYRRGLFVDKSYEKALEYYRKIKELGDHEVEAKIASILKKMEPRKRSPIEMGPPQDRPTHKKRKK
jgi:hypothetical protein